LGANLTVANLIPSHINCLNAMSLFCSHKRMTAATMLIARRRRSSLIACAASDVGEVPPTRSQPLWFPQEAAFRSVGHHRCHQVLPYLLLLLKQICQFSWRTSLHRDFWYSQTDSRIAGNPPRCHPPSRDSRVGDSILGDQREWHYQSHLNERILCLYCLESLYDRSHLFELNLGGLCVLAGHPFPLLSVPSLPPSTWFASI
jgi:hypothetical protein